MKRKRRIEGTTPNTDQVNEKSEDEASETTKLLQAPKPIFSIVKHYPPSWLQTQMSAAKKEP